MASRPLTCLGLVIAILVPPIVATVAEARLADGHITGQVTDAHGAPLAGIGVAAVPIGGDSVVQTQTGPDGRYALDLPAGSYDVGFNTQVFGPVDVNYDPAVYGGPGPGPNESCAVCHGATVTVTAAATTSNIDGSLVPAPFTQHGFVRPLSGRTIGLVNHQLNFKVGCHEYPDGCAGTAYLRLGNTTNTATIARTTISLAENEVSTLHFKIPTALQKRLRQTRGRGLRATVQLVTAQSNSVTHFNLVA